MQQKRICNTDDLITPAAYAKGRGLNRSTVCRQIAKGAIPTHDGKVDPAEADEARRNNLSILRGRRKAIQEPDVGAILERFLLDAFHDGQRSTVQALTRAQNVQVIAETGLALGCSFQQAVLMATWYGVWLATWTVSDDEFDSLRIQPQVNWAALAARIGESVTPKQVKAWLAASGPAIDGWYRAHPEKAAISGKEKK
jgi:hypothetical protein